MTAPAPSTDMRPDPAARPIVRMTEMAWDEYDRRIRAGAVVLLPVGATEQHGYHLPLGVDVLLADHVCDEVARRIGGLVAPAIPYGFRSQVRTGGGPHRIGTIGLGASSLIAVTKDVLMELARHGVRRIAVVDGHFENRFILDDACHQAAESVRALGIMDLKIVKFAAGEPQSPEVTARVHEGLPNPGPELEHAGLEETAWMLHCFPHLVHMHRMVDEEDAQFPPYDVFPPDPGWVPRSGCLSSGRAATADMGRQLAEDTIARMADALRKEFEL